MRVGMRIAVEVEHKTAGFPELSSTFFEESSGRRIR